MCLAIFSGLMVIETAEALGADVSLSADFVNRYIWRGLDVNSAANVQPSLSLTAGGFGIGFWGSYSLTQANASDDNYAVSSEVDLWASYTHTFGNGAGLSGSESFPLGFYA